MKLPDNVIQVPLVGASVGTQTATVHPKLGVYRGLCTGLVAYRYRSQESRSFKTAVIDVLEENLDAVCRFVVYSEQAGSRRYPGTLLAQSEEVTGVHRGVVRFTFAEPVSLSAGTVYWIGIFTTSDFAARALASGQYQGALLTRTENRALTGSIWEYGNVDQAAYERGGLPSQFPRPAPLNAYVDLWPDVDDDVVEVAYLEAEQVLVPGVARAGEQNLAPRRVAPTSNVRAPGVTNNRNVTVTVPRTNGGSSVRSGDNIGLDYWPGDLAVRHQTAGTQTINPYLIEEKSYALQPWDPLELGVLDSYITQDYGLNTGENPYNVTGDNGTWYEEASPFQGAAGVHPPPVEPGLFGGASFFALSVSDVYDNLLPSLIGAATVPHSPVVTSGSFVSPPRIASSASVYAASLANPTPQPASRALLVACT